MRSDSRWRRRRRRKNIKRKEKNMPHDIFVQCCVQYDDKFAFLVISHSLALALSASFVGLVSSIVSFLVTILLLFISSSYSIYFVLCLPFPFIHLWDYLAFAMVSVKIVASLFDISTWITWCVCACWVSTADSLKWKLISSVGARFFHS